ncbi:MAG TPA: NAD(P)/FAD-dependent oxidoreductase [Acidimicrobiia bacterium]|jgi:geranylgeranyl reductase family protein|nr:NAD(P)/FAD-dependent oxidoreductase [Acidimicrobiia bacterium]
MSDRRFDALVVGAGPAGSIAATVLARGGARVALVDKAAFPRDKACGDLVGPRGVQLLLDLALEVPDTSRVSDMVVVGPTGNRVRLPAPPGRTYPGYGIVVQRSVFDATLQRAAIAAGAEFYEGRAGESVNRDGRLDGFSLSPTTQLRADVIIGADGATSRVAEAAGLVDPERVLWAFAVRTYLDEPVEVPHIMLWTPTPGVGFPGYGWVFPAGVGQANVGLGVGVLADRTAGRRAARDLDAFLAHAARVGVLSERAPARSGARPLGAWLKMGLVGTTPARDRVFLAGDAAGLVNPLQGEGIAQAMDSGRAAAESILDGIDGAPARYRAHLARAHAPYLATTASIHRSLLGRPRGVAALTRLLTAPGVGRSIAGGWSITWNNLRDGATPSIATGLAATAAGLGHALTARSPDRRWITKHLGD